MYKIVNLSLSSDLLTGVEKVDEQHRTIIKLAEVLANSVGEQISIESVWNSLNFLGSYVDVHFKDEEEFQISIGYPRYKEHKKMHQGFMQSFIQLKTEYSQNGHTEAIVKKITNYVVDWVFDHINKQDLDIAKYYRNVVTRDYLRNKHYS